MAIHRPQVAVFVGPLVPDAHAVVFQISNIGIAVQKPQQLDDDGAQVQLLGGQHRKALRQIKSQLVTKQAMGPGPRPVPAKGPVGPDFF